MESWQEEVEILAQEFRRAICGFGKMEVVWTAMAADHTGMAGKKAYGLKTAAMYRRMAADALKAFIKAGGTWPAARVSLAEHIWS
jgi:hypothetical protein